MAEYLYYNTIPFSIIATKADKLSKAQTGRCVQKIATSYKCGISDILVTSSQTRQGLDGVLEKIERILDNI